MKLTDNQQKAVELENRNILVSAAAGSGKTSVLVTRIIRRITSSENPVDIDRLLIMTFTSAAAKEMKDRIRKAIEKGLDSNPNDENLIRQSVLIHNAQIMTIHSFCQTVIRDNFERINIDPNFRVADDNEAKLLRMDALSEVLERYYDEGNEDFLTAVDSISGAKNDSKFEDTINGLFFFAMSNPEPDRFLDECIRNYCADSVEEFMKLPVLKDYVEIYKAQVKSYSDMVKSTLDIANAMEELSKYAGTIEKDFERLEHIVSAKDYNEFRNRVNSIEFDALPRTSTKGLSEEALKSKDKIGKLRNTYKDNIRKTAKAFAQPVEEVYKTIAECRPVVEVLVKVVKDYEQRYSEKKADKNLIDFNDMEHMAIRILRENPEVAESYREHFEEIYVDEYQDSNMTQETLVSLIKRENPSGNVFMVGDVKQSIYRFRQARPDLFVGKYDSYTDSDSQNQRIILNDNFRSRKNVVDSVNEIFRTIMKKELGNIEYDYNAELKYGATYYDEADNCKNDVNENSSQIEKVDYDTELLVVAGDEMPAMELEVNAIANKINEIVASGFTVYDTNTSTLRPVTYRDIVILLRSYKGYEACFKQVFRDNNIPLAVAASEGYFTTTEVQTILSFLSVVDNPLQDIPLAAVMHSPLGGFSNEEMALLRADCGNERLYYSVIKFCQKCTDEQETDENVKKIIEKCISLTEKLQYYRRKASYTTVYGILQEIIDNEYADYVRSSSNGQQKLANLDMLMVKAQEYGKTSFTGLFNFVRYMDLIKKYDIEAGEAEILSEEDDVVKIMTIHSSKGLEFPVCFVAGIEKQRNTKDETRNVVWDVTFGIGVEHVDLDKRVKRSTLCSNIIKQQIVRENIAEEMRVLYVAMTRAREKLYLVGYSKNEDIFDEKIVSPAMCKSYFDMLSVAYFKQDGSFNNIKIKAIGAADIVSARVKSELIRESVKDDVLEIVRDFNQDTYMVPDSLCGMNDFYKYRDEYSVPAKLSVSELKKRSYKSIEDDSEQGAPVEHEMYKDEETTYIPTFMREEGETDTGGSFYGTAFHRILELWEYSNENPGEADVENFAKEMLAKHRMEEEQVNAVKPADVAFFLNSDTGKRLYAAKQNGKLHREQPFVIGIPKWEVATDATTATVHMTRQAEDEDIVLVQGIIDAFYEEEDGIVILDYKTDRVKRQEELVDKYRVQLEYYKKALGQITGKEIKEMIIYSSRLRKSIVL